MYKYIIIILIFLSACEKEYNKLPEIKPLNTIVIESIITNEIKEQLVKLSYPIDSFNAKAKPISGAKVSIADKYSTIIFNEHPILKGHYYSQTFQGLTGRNYTLKVSFSGNIYEAIASMVPLITKDSFVLAKEGTLYKYIQLYSEIPIMIELNYDWSMVQGYEFKKNSALEYLYTLNNIDVNKSFAPDKEKILVPAGTKIIKKRYSLTQQHQAFLRSLLMETEWSGGLFDVQRANVKTNISNGGLGFFAACTVVTDTIIVK